MPSASTMFSNQPPWPYSLGSLLFHIPCWTSSRWTRARYLCNVLSETVDRWHTLAMRETLPTKSSPAKRADARGLMRSCNTFISMHNESGGGVLEGGSIGFCQPPDVQPMPWNVCWVAHTFAGVPRSSCKISGLRPSSSPDLRCQATEVLKRTSTST